MNRIIDSGANALAVAGRTLPWLQDTTQQDVWARWSVVYRDVRVLDSQNGLAAVYNLSANDLALVANRNALKQLLLVAAQVVDVDGDKLPDDWELKYFGHLSALPGGDADGDGRDNFTECAFGTDPTDAQSYRSVVPGTIHSGGQNYLSAKFRRRAGGVFSYLIETSPDMQSWTASPAEFVIQGTPVNRFDGTGTVEATYSLTGAMNNHAKKFLRVRAVPANLP